MNNKIVEEIISHKLTKKVIKQALNESKGRSWVFDQIESLIECIDDCTIEGALIFDELEDRIDCLLT